MLGSKANTVGYVRYCTSISQYFLMCWLFLVLTLSGYVQSKEEKYFIHNHLSFIVKYHKDMQSDSARIVGFEVKPFRSVIQGSYDIFKMVGSHLIS
jgi:hypothetical protein